MASWTSDPALSGYDPSAGRFFPRQVFFASIGSVDVQHASRMQYGGRVFFASAAETNSLVFTNTDVSFNTGRQLTATLFMVNAALFAPGVIPTASEILAQGSNVRAWRNGFSTTVAASVPFGINGPADTELEAGSKYWFLLMPTSVASMGLPANTTNDKPLANYTADNSGRAVSIWTNRTPKAPVITSPVSGAIVPPGSAFTLAYQSNDPDKAFGGTSYYYTDVAGVHVQYAAQATPENPTPAWTDLPVGNSGGTEFLPGWAIRQSTAPGNGAQALLNTDTMLVRCGSNVIWPAQGALPSGSWQIRMRVYDYGHPDPAISKPLANLRTAETLVPSTYPAVNTSPWSEPVNVSVPAQVPPPIALTPRDSLAFVEGKPISLTWQYRNTSTPPFDQAERTVQIREVGSATWTTLVSEASSSNVFVLPPLSPSVHEYLADPGFEDGTLGGWEISGLGSLGGLVNSVGVPPDVHTGSHALLANFSNAIPGVYTPMWQTLPLTTGDNYFRLSGWIRPSAAKAYTLSLTWLNASHVTVQTDVDSSVAIDSDWTEFIRLYSRPATAVEVQIQIYPSNGSPTGDRLDDFSFVGSDQPIAVVTPRATTAYEWRVQVVDADGEESNYSQPARFWVVPAPASGSTRPLPTSTIEGATLGCGAHRAFVYRRGGLERVGEIRNISYLDWGRVRDDVSTSKIIVSGWDVDCGYLLASLQTWAYEIVIFRDNGYSIDRVWEGPITLLTYEHDSVTINSKDVMAYPYRRIIKQKMSDTANGDTVVSRATRVLQNTLGPDDPNLLAYLTPLIREDDVMQYRSTPAFSRTAFEEIDDMAANAGLDYTAVGRSILLWGTKHRIGTLPEFRDSDLGNIPIVSEYGMSAANFYSVSDGNGVHGDASRLDEDGLDPVYGLLEMLSSTWASDSTDDSGTYTQAGLNKMIASFASFAERSIADRFPPPVIVRIPDNTTINPDAVISIQQLVPGVAIPLRSTGTLRSVVGTQKLDSVKVVQTDAGETVSITLSPFSRDDAAPEVDEA